MPRYAWCLVIVAAGLIAVGVESGTVLRHLIQAAPVLLVLILSLRRTAWAADAALPIFAVWLALMAAVWLYLLGVARIVTGRFPLIEIALTVVIGSGAIAGLVLAVRSSTARWPVRVITGLAFGVVQLMAMWLSMRRL